MIRTIRLALIVLALSGATLAQEGLDPNVEGRNATLKRAFTALNESCCESVVAVRQGSSHKGYGVILRQGVLTSAQVVTSTGTYTLVDRDGQEHTAKVLARSAKEDLALLEVPPGVGAPRSLASTDQLEIGSYLLTVGPSEPLAVGVLGAKNRAVQRSLMQQNILLGLFQDGNEGHTRSYRSVLQHDGMLEKQHLGSPLVNRDGDVVGINVALPFRGSAHAVPTEVIRVQLEAWGKEQVVEEGPAAEGPVEPLPAPRPEPDPIPPGGIYLGVNANDAPLEQVPPTHKHGILVVDVTPDGPAAKGGLQADDVILELDGQALKSLDHLGSLLSECQAGQTVTFKVMRERRMTTVEVVLQTR